MNENVDYGMQGSTMWFLALMLLLFGGGFGGGFGAGRPMNYATQEQV